MKDTVIYRSEAEIFLAQLEMNSTMCVCHVFLSERHILSYGSPFHTSQNCFRPHVDLALENLFRYTQCVFGSFQALMYSPTSCLISWTIVYKPKGSVTAVVR